MAIEDPGPQAAKMNQGTPWAMAGSSPPESSWGTPLPQGGTLQARTSRDILDVLGLGNAREAPNWTESAEEEASWTGPAKTTVRWTGPAEKKMSWTGPTETKISWTGPTLGGARKALILWGAGEERALGGARVERNWMEPAEASVSWQGPAEASVSWQGPAEASVSWQGPAGAGRNQRMHR